MAHTAFITAHALAALVSLGTGAVALWSTAPGSPWFRGYTWALFLMVGFLLCALVVDWSHLDATRRYVFSALFALAIYVLWRGVRAGARLHGQAPGWRTRYLDDLGFTLISLLEGFVIVAAIDIGTVWWLIVLIGVVVLAAGITAIGRLKARSA